MVREVQVVFQMRLPCQCLLSFYPLPRPGLSIKKAFLDTEIADV